MIRFVSFVYLFLMKVGSYVFSFIAVWFFVKFVDRGVSEISEFVRRFRNGVVLVLELFRYN